MKPKSNILVKKGETDMAKTKEDKLLKAQKGLLDIFEIFLKNNEIIKAVIEDCSQSNVKKIKKDFNQLNIKDHILELDNTIVEVLISNKYESEISKKAIVYLKISSDLMKLYNNLRTIVAKLTDCCDGFKNDDVKKFGVDIYDLMGKMIENISMLLKQEDLDDMNETYNEIVLLEEKLDNVYEKVSDYSFKDSKTQKVCKNIKTVFRKTEKVASRVVSVAALINFEK